MASESLENGNKGAQTHITEADYWLDQLPEDLKSVSSL
jgi:hypothetical protein